MDKVLVDNLYEFLNYNKSFYSIDKCTKDEIAACLDIILKDISLMEEEKDFEKNDFSMVDKTLQKLVSSTIESEITDRYKDFIKNYSFLVFNWNENTYKDEAIRDKCQHLSRFADDCLLVDEFLTYATTISDRLHQTSAYEPASFKLSEHYLNIINEE